MGRIRDLDGNYVGVPILDESGALAPHEHAGSDITSGTVADARIAATIARDSEITAAVDAAVSALVASAPAALNTLDELAAALSDDANFATTITNALAGKAASGHTHSVTLAIPFVIDGGGSAIAAGVKGYLPIPFACTITGWTLVADVSGSIVVDVWKDTYANYPPVVGDTIWGGSKPTLSSAIKNSATGLSIAVAAGDILGFNADATPATVTLVTLVLTATRSV